MKTKAKNQSTSSDKKRKLNKNTKTRGKSNVSPSINRLTGIDEEGNGGLRQTSFMEQSDEEPKAADKISKTIE